MYKVGKRSTPLAYKTRGLRSATLTMTYLNQLLFAAMSHWQPLFAYYILDDHSGHARGQWRGSARRDELSLYICCIMTPADRPLPGVSLFLRAVSFSNRRLVASNETAAVNAVCSCRSITSLR